MMGRQLRDAAVVPVERAGVDGGVDGGRGSGEHGMACTSWNHRTDAGVSSARQGSAGQVR
jgi:hypothetical protein